MHAFFPFVSYCVTQCLKFICEAVYGLNVEANPLSSNVFIFVLLGKTSVDKPLLEYMNKKLNTR